MTHPDAHRALEAATAIARRLTRPHTAGNGSRWLAQSLAKGAAGIALLHIERARTSHGDWDAAHAWLSAATGEALSAGPNAGLYFGTPAVAYALHAAADAPGKYQRALTALDDSVTAITRRRLDKAHARLDRGEPPALAEFDLIYGLTGLGVYHLKRRPRSDQTRDVLSYLVRLTEPLHHRGNELPGWWSHLAPSGRRSAEYPDGHGNLGMAHGIAGPLALLSLAMRHGVVVVGHAEAIARICAWLDSWRQDQTSGAWWPQWITVDELQQCQTRQPGPLRPSWCYGTPGLARAQQLAALATGDTCRQEMAEAALLGCLADPEQLARITDTGLCHGSAGLHQTVWRVASEARTAAITDCLSTLLDKLLNRQVPNEDPGLLEGMAGHALALHTVADSAPSSGWDACLLLN